MPAALMGAIGGEEDGAHSSASLDQTLRLARALVSIRQGVLDAALECSQRQKEQEDAAAAAGQNSDAKRTAVAAAAKARGRAGPAPGQSDAQRMPMRVSRSRTNISPAQTFNPMPSKVCARCTVLSYRIACTRTVQLESTQFNCVSATSGALVSQRRVEMRVMFDRIFAVDTLHASFRAEIFIHTRWRVPELDGLSSEVCRTSCTVLFSTRMVIRCRIYCYCYCTRQALELRAGARERGPGHLLEPDALRGQHRAHGERVARAERQERGGRVLGDRAEDSARPLPAGVAAAPLPVRRAGPPLPLPRPAPPRRCVQCVPENCTATGNGAILGVGKVLQKVALYSQDLCVTVTSEMGVEEMQLVPNTRELAALDPSEFEAAQEWHLYRHVELTQGTVLQEYSSRAPLKPTVTATVRVARLTGYFYYNVYFITVCTLIQYTLLYGTLQSPVTSCTLFRTATYEYRTAPLSSW